MNERKFGITSTQKGNEVDFKDSYLFEIAAYELDKLLGLNMVPPTVERSFNGKKGSVQLWVENCMTEKDRKLKKMDPPDLAIWNTQIFQVRLFDNLLYNIDRNLGNLLIDDEWKVYMIDHSRSFKNLSLVKTPGDLSMFSKATMEALDRASLMHFAVEAGDVETVLAVGPDAARGGASRVAPPGARAPRVGPPSSARAR